MRRPITAITVLRSIIAFRRGTKEERVAYRGPEIFPRSVLIATHPAFNEEHRLNGIFVRGLRRFQVRFLPLIRPKRLRAEQGSLARRVEHQGRVRDLYKTGHCGAVMYANKRPVPTVIYYSRKGSFPPPAQDGMHVAIRSNKQRENVLNYNKV
eukprot:8248076-Pyramimonas_sp.AAC.1